MQTLKTLGIIGTLAALTIVGVSVLANPPAWDVPQGENAFGDSENRGPGATIRQAAHLRMQLGRYYLLSGDYEAALDQYVAIASTEVPEEILAEHPGAGERGAEAKSRAWLMAAVASELLGDREQALLFAETGQALLPEPGDGQRGRRGDRAASREDGSSDDDAQQRRERREQRCSGDMSPEECRGQMREGGRSRHGARGHHGRHGRRGPDTAQAFERFLEDPSAFAERFAGGAAALEARLLVLEAELSENAR